MYMSSYAHRPPSTAASRHAKLIELVRQCIYLAERELEVERRSRALNLNAVGDARVRAAAPWQEVATHVLGTGTFESQVVLVLRSRLRDP